MVSPEAINQIYAKEIVPLVASTDLPDSKGTRNLGMTLLWCKHVVEAIDKLNKALVIDPDDLVARNALADAYATEVKNRSVLPNLEEALRHKDIVIEQLNAGTKLYTDEEADVSRKLLISGKASWLRELKRYEEAQELLRCLLVEDPNDDTIRLLLIRTLYQSRKLGEVVELLQAMEKQVDESTKTTAVSRFLQFHAQINTWHNVLVSAFRQESQFEGVTSYYRMAIKDCASSKERIAQWRHCYLIDHLASMLFKFGTGSDERE